MPHDEVSKERFAQVRSLLQEGPGDAHQEWSDTLGTRLTHLDLNHNGFGREGLKVLLEQEWVRGLEELSLSGNHLDTTGGLLIAYCERLSNLKRLNLWQTGMTYDTGVVLRASKHLTNLEYLNVRND